MFTLSDFLFSLSWHASVFLFPFSWGFCVFTACPTGKFGLGCLYTCSCLSSNSVCSPIDGTCTCHAGYRGHNCDRPCASGMWGLGCTQACNCFNGQCNPVTGQCQCGSGWTGTSCDQRCPAGTYGIGCNCKYNNTVLFSRFVVEGCISQYCLEGYTSHQLDDCIERMHLPIH